MLEGPGPRESVVETRPSIRPLGRSSEGLVEGLCQGLQKGLWKGFCVCVGLEVLYIVLSGSRECVLWDSRSVVTAADSRAVCASWRLLG